MRLTFPVIDSHQKSSHLIFYAWQPLRCKDWERALLEFTLAMIVKPATGMQPKDALGKRLKEITCPGESHTIIFEQLSATPAGES